MTDQAKPNRELAEENATLRERIRRLEAQLRDSLAMTEEPGAHNEPFFSLWNEYVDALYIHDLEGRIIDVNDRACRHTGHSREELLDRSVFDLHPAGEPSKNLPREDILGLWSLCQPGERFTFEGEHQRRDGSIFPVEITTGALHGKQGYRILAIVKDISDRKQAEETLRASELRMRAITMSAQDAIIMMDPDGRISHWNPSAERFFGYSSDETVGRNLHHLLAPEHYRPAFDAAFPEFQRSGRGAVVGKTNQSEAMRKSGEVFPIELSLSSVKLNDGWHAVGIVRDITDRRQAEETLNHRLLYEQMLSRISALAVEEKTPLRFEEESLRIMGETLEVSRVYLFEHDHQNDCMDNTAEWCAPGETPQKDNLQGIPASDAPWWTATLKAGGIICFSNIEDIPDEGAKDILRAQDIRAILAVPLFVAGRYYGFVGFDECRFHREWPAADVEILQTIARIISGAVYKKFAEEEIEKERRQLLSIFNSIDESIYISDPQTYEILYVNQKLENTLQRDCVGGLCYQEFQGFDAPCHFCTNDIILRQKPHPYYWEHYNPSLEKHFFLCDRIIDWPDGRQVRFEMATDITDRKHAEAEREKLQAQLQQAQKLESVGTLAGGIAHDFNNLLMGIQGNASLMMHDLDPSHPHHERLRHVEESVASAADLTKQLLGFSQGGRYNVKPHSMNEIIEKSSALFGRTKKEISLHRKYSPDPCVVDVDRSQMEQVFMNLFVNAWQAMPGGGDLFIETEAVVVDDARAAAGTVEPGRYVRVNVTDTGTGMDERTKERIFDPFFTTKGMGRGTGLGLATVYGIVKGHGGMISVYSEPGHGTTFSLYLPASQRDPAGERAPAGEVVRGTETILLIDDEPVILNVSRAMLESLGYRVYTAASGQEALALYTEKRDAIDLVILDMIMPGLSGSGTFDQLREINPGVKVLLASGYSINGMAREIMDRGCDGFIQKPFTLEGLSRSVREALG